MAKPPYCEVPDCEWRVFYVNGPHCLEHIRNPISSDDAGDEESESSDDNTTP